MIHRTNKPNPRPKAAESTFEFTSIGRKLLVIAFCLSASLTYSAEPSSAPKPAFRADIVLVGFNSGTTAKEQATILTNAGARELRVIGQGVHVVKVPAGRVKRTIESLTRLPAVRYAEPDFRHELNGAPNDPYFPQQWAFQNTGQHLNGVTGTSGADEGTLKAWSVTTGSRSVVVAVVDTGIDYNHPDLAANIWSNPGGINGCPAGTHGYNVLTSTCDPMDDDATFGGHGTHVSGIIGAVSNNAVGVAGINWQTTLLGVKWVDANDNGYTSDLITALDWVVSAKQAGVNIRVVNDSQTWAGTAASQALSDEIDALGANDILFVTAAGNTAQNNDTTPRYPCVYDRPNQICALASDQNDRLWSSSNYGQQTVQLAAPGANIFSTLRNSSYGYISGCSMSAAEVSGSAALILSLGYQSATTLRSTLLSAVDSLPAFASITQTGGRLDICKAIPGCTASAPVNTALPAISGTPTAGQTLTVSNGTWSGNPTSFAYQWQRCDSSGANCAAIGGASANTYTLTSADVSSTIRASVTATNSAGSSSATSQATPLVQGSGSGIVLVQKVAAQGSGQGSLSVSFPANNQAGNTIVAFVRASTTSQTVAVSDSRGNRYIDAVDQTQDADGSQTHIFYAANIASGANAVTASFSGTNNHPWVAISEYSGLSSNPLDVTASAQGSGTLASSATTPQTHAPNELIFTGLGLPASSSVSVTPGGGYLLELQDPNAGGSRAAAEDQIVGSTGSFAGTFNLSGAANWSVVLATFVAAGSTTPPPLTVTTTSLPQATQGAAYNASIAASGGTPPYNWSVSGSLPPGLSLASSGAISGTPSSAGSYSFTVTVTDSKGSTASQALSIQINPSTTTPISLVQTAQVQGSGVSSVAQSFPNANTAGNLIIAFVRMSTTSQTVQVADSLGNIYTQAVTQSQDTDGSQTYIFYARNIAGGSNTVTAAFSSTNNHPWLAIYEYSGLSATSPLDQTAHTQGSSSVASSGLTAQTTSANELIFGAVGLPASSTQTVAAGSGFVLVQQDAPPNHSRGANETKTSTAVGQFAASFNISGSANWSALVATFKQ